MCKKVIVRGKSSGLFFGTLVEKNGSEVKLTHCRQLWHWAGAASHMQIATDGVLAPQKCKFTVTVDEITILDAIEIVPCSPKAIASIESIAPWKR